MCRASTADEYATHAHLTQQLLQARLERVGLLLQQVVALLGTNETRLGRLQRPVEGEVRW